MSRAKAADPRKITGLTDTTASNSSFLTSLYCVIIPFLGWALHGPRPTRLRFFVEPSAGRRSLSSM